MTDPHELFADRLMHVYRRSGATFLHSTVLASAVAGFLISELPWLPVLVWWAAITGAVGYHSFLGKRLMTLEMRAMSGVSTHSLTVFSALAGLSWGAGAAFLPFISPHLQLLLLLTLMAIGAASLPRMAALPVVHAAFMAGLFLPILVALIVVYGLHHWMMAIVLLVIWGVLTHEARRAHIDLVEIYSARQSFQAEALRDRLTGIPNRRAFDTTLDREWRRAQRLGAPLSLVMIDVDYFKKYNDRYGHQEGDECLVKVARALAGPRRAADLVARYGGEEFVALLFHTPRDDGLAVASGMRQAVAALEIPHADGPAGVVTISLGGATCIPRADQESAETLLRAADTALYQAKAQGRNRVAWSTDGMSGLQDRWEK